MLTGSLPSEIGLLSLASKFVTLKTVGNHAVRLTFPFVTQVLDGNENRLSGQIPSEIGLLSNLGTCFQYLSFVR